MQAGNFGNVSAIVIFAFSFKTRFSVSGHLGGSVRLGAGGVAINSLVKVASA